MSKAAGGLGIKKASTWNIASVGKLVNWIYVKADRLWIKWIDSVYLKGMNWNDYTPGGLNTKARLFSYGCYQDDLCILCAEQAETNEHLFTECKFSCQVQKYVEDWIERPFPTDSELLNVSHSSMKWKALALVLSCYRYTVWHQRNLARTQFSVARPVLLAERMKMVVQQQIRKFTDRRGGQNELNARTWIGLC
ncbi:uncharacterized protein LOC141649495 [Silene latifolia]|uniref:uncharacterized protein LOC141649495 n=1 Tax=Silene latifolia TaxID=37657 RepID=UPI003D76E225